MKKIALIIGLLALVASTRAAEAAPNSINFTGRLSTSSGPVNGNVDITFTFYTAQTGGSAVWSDTLTGLTATQGLVFATLGSATNPLDETVFTDSPLYLEIIVGTETLSPRLPIQSVPYAVRATSAGSADTLGGTITPADVVTSVTPAASGGLTGGGSGGNVTLGVDTTTIQKRVSGTCASGAINTVNADGTVSCSTPTAEVDGVIGNEVTNTTDTTLIRSGSGTAASPYTLGVNTAVVQSRVSGTCSGANAIQTVAANGTVTCAPTGITTEGDGVIGNEVTNTTDTTLTRSGAGTAASPYTLGVNTAVVQSRVTGTCPAGQAISTVAANGTVTCQTIPTAPITVTSTDSGSMALGSSGGCTTSAGKAVTITVPAGGTISVHATFWLMWNHTTGTKDQAVVGIVDSGGACVPAGDWSQVYVKDDPAALGTDSGQYDSGQVWRNFTVASAGTYTYSLGGYMALGYVANTDYIWYSKMYAEWHP